MKPPQGETYIPQVKLVIPFKFFPNMIKLNEAIADFLVGTKILLNNSIDDSIIRSSVALFGYDEIKLSEAKSLFSILEDLYKTQLREYEDQYLAQNVFQNKREVVNEHYMDLITISKIAFKNDIGAQQTLGINQIRKKSYSGWYSQALEFYDNLITSPSYTVTLEAYGQSIEKVKAVKQQILETRIYAEVHKSEKEEAQQTSQIRDEILDLLIEWVSDYKKIARIALKDKPHLLETLGLSRKSF